MAAVPAAGEPLSPQAANLIRRIARVVLDEPADLMAEVYAAVLAAQTGSSVRLVAPPPLLRKIIRITGLADRLPVHRADQAGHVQVA